MLHSKQEIPPSPALPPLVPREERVWDALGVHERNLLSVRLWVLGHSILKKPGPAAASGIAAPAIGLVRLAGSGQFEEPNVTRREDGTRAAK